MTAAAHVSLTAYLRGLTQDPSMQLVEVPDALVASVSLQERLVRLGSPLMAADPRVRAGVLAHECGHAICSRYGIFSTSQGFASRSLWASLLNSMEEARAEAAISQRFPGVKQAIQAAARALRGYDCPNDLPDLFRFSLEASRDQDRGWNDPAGGEPSAPWLRLLQSTRQARRYYAESTTFMPEMTEDDSLATYVQRVVPRLVDEERHVVPVHLERIVRIQAVDALRFLETTIFPALISAGREDRHALAVGLVADRPLREEVRACLRSPGPRPVVALTRRVLARRGGRMQPDSNCRRLAYRLYDGLWEDGVEGKPRGFDERSDGTTGPCSATSDRRRGYESLNLSAMRQSVGAQVHRLHSDLRDVLRIPAPSIKQCGYRTGSTVKLSGLMRTFVDPLPDDRIWMRRRAPEVVQDAVWQILCDCSGSMRGSKIEAVIPALMLLGEVLDSLEVKWGVWGFNSRLFLVKSFDERLDDTQLLHLAQETEGPESPWNDDGPAVEQATVLLNAQPEAEKVMLVLSDGEPAGQDSGPADLHRAVASATAQRIKLIGMGVGPSTDHVRRYYPNGVGNVPLAQFGARLAEMVLRVVRDDEYRMSA